MMKSLMRISALCLLATSCTALRTSPAKAPIDFDPGYLNRQIRLVVVKELSAFNTRNDVALHLEYATSNEIVFPSNYNLRIFIQQGNAWVETSEKPTIRPAEPIVLSPSVPSSYGQIVAFRPQLPDPAKTYYVRLYVFGTMKAPAGPRLVAAFVDFVLTP